MSSSFSPRLGRSSRRGLRWRWVHLHTYFCSLFILKSPLPYTSLYFHISKYAKCNFFLSIWGLKDGKWIQSLPFGDRNRLWGYIEGKRYKCFFPSLALCPLLNVGVGQNAHGLVSVLCLWPFGWKKNLRENQFLFSMSKFHQPIQPPVSVFRGSVFVSSGGSETDVPSLIHAFKNSKGNSEIQR